MTIARSLFDRPSSEVLPAASEWVTGTLLGSLAVTLCVLAIAFVGLMLMSGRLAVRDGARVMLGCFVLLGAPLIAAGLRGVADEASASVAMEPLVIEPAPAAPPLPPSTYDPYAGASLRRD